MMNNVIWKCCPTVWGTKSCLLKIDSCLFLNFLWYFYCWKLRRLSLRVIAKVKTLHPVDQISSWDNNILWNSLENRIKAYSNVTNSDKRIKLPSPLRKYANVGTFKALDVKSRSPTSIFPPPSVSVTSFCSCRVPSPPPPQRWNLSMPSVPAVV